MSFQKDPEGVGERGLEAHVSPVTPIRVHVSLSLYLLCLVEELSPTFLHLSTLLAKEILQKPLGNLEEYF